MTAPPLILILAMGRNRVIGAAERLPWRLASDLKLFKQETLGAPVLMGRATWASLPKRPLPQRDNIVLSRASAFRAGGAWCFSSLETGLAAARARAAQTHARAVYCIGGAQIYASLLDQAEAIILTEVDLAPAGDAFFPPLPPLWRASLTADWAQGPGDEARFRVWRYTRA